MFLHPLCLFIPVLLTNFVSALDFHDELSFQLDLIKHQPCVHSQKSKWHKKIEFEAGNANGGPKLETVQGKDNCFKIGGKVQIHEDITGELSIFVEIRNSPNRKQVPEMCQKQPETGCGGIGSCLYCNVCKNFDELAVEAQLLLDGKPVKCTDGLKKGIYENIHLQFCLPKMEEILKSQGLSKETFLQLIQGENENSLRATGVFATVYLFDSDVSKQMSTQARVVSVYRKTKKSLFKNEQLPAEVYWSLPFNQMIATQQPYIACHKIYANLKVLKQ
ncbi:hypothetical protein WR25_12977 [Diploscapter pachys]|uniref:Uncharacterized protein n=1 Tax=Diploscapter pachys TaxID=2018661 RepID=A0A2A2LK45_9BILA|nr:hypothetical protein WR25_12977 [Diploscapter pachys]